MIKFNVPPYVGKENEYINKVISNHKICGDGEFTKKCNEWFMKKIEESILLTTSGTSALEIAALLLDIKPGDEVIMPSYTFCSTANAFILRGAKIKFVDIRPDTMNIDENLIENAITQKTKAIVPVHYAGVSCEMDKIINIAKKYDIKIVEDAAQGVMSKYKGKWLGTIGDYGCYSFHETKNYSMGEGGAIIVKDKNKFEKAEIIREKGTDRSKFIRGQVDKYTWVSKGSSFLPSELNAAYLYAQLEFADEINNNRLKSWDLYYENLRSIKQIDLPIIPKECKHNAHMFYIKTKDLNERTKLIEFLRNKGIYTAFHYIPLHSSPAGMKYGEFIGKDVYTTKESERLLRLPMYYCLKEIEIKNICDEIKKFYN